MGKLKKGTQQKKVKVQGWDISLNHCGMVELEDGELSRWWYVTDITGSFKKFKGSIALLVPSKEKHESSDIYEVRRLNWWDCYLDNHVDMSKPDYVGVEGYAMNAMRGSHQIGELGGLAKLACWDLWTKLRVHDPLSIKMFSTHNGHAQKPEVEAAVLERWGADFSECNPPMSKPSKKHPEGHINRQTSEDLADAFAIAKLVWCEIQLRDGSVLLSDLHPKEIQVFNRATKGYPVNILGREWIERTK